MLKFSISENGNIFRKYFPNYTYEDKNRKRSIIYGFLYLFIAKKNFLN